MRIANRRVSTGLIADELADWFRTNSPVHLPWLASRSRWTVIQAELLWSRIACDNVSRAWAAIRTLETPEATLAAIPLLRRLAAQWQREARCEQLAECAEWFIAHPDALSAAATAVDLIAAPHVTSAMADLACRVVPGDAEDPVLAGFGVLRVAARFQGGTVDRRNRLSDGRLALARMVGGDESSHAAQLALIELANGICSPVMPACGRCPLEPWCAEASGLPVQKVLPLTNRDRRPGQERVAAACP